MHIPSNYKTASSYLQPSTNTKIVRKILLWKKFNAHNVPNNLISMYVLTNFVQEEDDVSTRVNNMLQNKIYNFHHTINSSSSFELYCIKCIY